MAGLQSEPVRLSNSALKLEAAFKCFVCIYQLVLQFVFFLKTDEY